MIRIRIDHHEAHKHGRGWAKVVTAVDRSQKGGYAFTGRSINFGQEVEVEKGAAILVVEHRGSRKNGYDHADVYRAGNDGLELELFARHWKNDFLEIRDTVERIIHF